MRRVLESRAWLLAGWAAQQAGQAATQGSIHTLLLRIRSTPETTLLTWRRTEQEGRALLGSQASTSGGCSRELFLAPCLAVMSLVAQM